MKRTAFPLFFSLFTLVLAGCAPTSEPPSSATASAQFRATCNEAISAVREASLHTRPVSPASWINSWTPFTVERWTDSEVNLTSRNIRKPVRYYTFSTFDRVVNTTVTCQESSGTVNLVFSSRGQNAWELAQMHQQLISKIALPRL